MAPAGPSAGPETLTLPGQLVITDCEFQRFRALIYQHTGIALGETKRQLVCSRLSKRLRHYGYPTFSQYYRHLTESDPKGEELLRMINAITTNKTDFFREADHFAFLSSELLAPFATRAQVGGPRRLRIWSAGCSSGEEPYSIAVTVLETLPSPWAWDVKILASDIDTDVLAQATDGVYRMERVATVPPEVLKRYFLRGRGERAGLVCVRKEVKDLMAFRRINLQDESWPIQTVFDAIFCRNVLIYFDRPGQERLIARFERLLSPGGFLFLGHSESLIGMQVGLRHIAKTIYQKAAESDRRAMVAHG